MQPSPILNGGTPIPPPAAVPGALCHANATPRLCVPHTPELSRSGGNINYYMYRRPASGIKSQRTLPKEKHRRRPNHRPTFNSTCSEEPPLCGGIAITICIVFPRAGVNFSGGHDNYYMYRHPPSGPKFQEPKELLGSGTTRNLRAKRRVIWTRQVGTQSADSFDTIFSNPASRVDISAKTQPPTALTQHIEIPLSNIPLSDLKRVNKPAVHNIPTEHPDFTVLGSFSRVSIAYLMNPTATWQITSFWPLGRENP
ncbi:hypothetical protein C8R43DRAFT_960536 [Mycena crocata]|nr:hypothetical protein C8R43DRAFT_960536 [Mycena crocata]